MSGLILLSLLTLLLFSFSAQAIHCSNERAVKQLEVVCGLVSKLESNQIMSSPDVYKELIFDNCGLSYVIIVNDSSYFNIVARAWKPATIDIPYTAIDINGEEILPKLKANYKPPAYTETFTTFLLNTAVDRDIVISQCESKIKEKLWAFIIYTKLSPRRASGSVIHTKAEFLNSQEYKNLYSQFKPDLPKDQRLQLAQKAARKFVELSYEDTAENFGLSKKLVRGLMSVKILEINDIIEKAMTANAVMQSYFMAFDSVVITNPVFNYHHKAKNTVDGISPGVNDSRFKLLEKNVVVLNKQVNDLNKKLEAENSKKKKTDYGFFGFWIAIISLVLCIGLIFI